MNFLIYMFTQRIFKLQKNVLELGLGKILTMNEFFYF